jgi:hypothetical protein
MVSVVELWLWEAVELKSERSPDAVTVTLGEAVNPYKWY